MGVEALSSDQIPPVELYVIKMNNSIFLSLHFRIWKIYGKNKGKKTGKEKEKKKRGKRNQEKSRERGKAIKRDKDK